MGLHMSRFVHPAFLLNLADTDSTFLLMRDPTGQVLDIWQKASTTHVAGYTDGFLYTQSLQERLSITHRHHNAKGQGLVDVTATYTRRIGFLLS